MTDEWSFPPLGPSFLFTDPPPSWLGNPGIGYKGKMVVDFWALVQITMSAVPQGGRTLFCLGSWSCPLHDQWRVFKAPSSGSFSSCYQPGQHGLAKTAQTGHCFSVITGLPLSVQSLGTQVDPGKANCCFSSARRDRLEWKVITAGWLTVPKRGKSGQTWVNWSTILANQPCAQTSNSQHLAIPGTILEASFVNKHIFR